MKRNRTGLLAAGLLGMAAVNANALQFSLEEFTGDDAELRVTITENAINNARIDFKLEVLNPAVASITAFWGSISDESLLPGLSIVNPSVTVEVDDFDANNVANLGGGANLNGGGPGPLDFGFRFDKPGDGTQTLVTFTLAHTLADLDVSLFEEVWFGARLQETGINNAGSSKLKGTSPKIPNVPDGGSTAALLGLGLLGVTALARRK